MVNVAILGFGTVGSGVADVLTRNSAVIDQRVDGLVRLKYILDVRDFPDSPYKDLFVKDFSVIENDPEVDVVVETIGGSRWCMRTRTCWFSTSLRICPATNPADTQRTHWQTSLLPTATGWVWT